MFQFDTKEEHEYEGEEEEKKRKAYVITAGSERICDLTCDGFLAFSLQDSARLHGHCLSWERSAANVIPSGQLRIVAPLLEGVAVALWVCESRARLERRRFVTFAHVTLHFGAFQVIGDGTIRSKRNDMNLGREGCKGKKRNS